MNLIKITLPYSDELLEELFGEFCWERGDISLPHPAQTGNCSESLHARPRGFEAEGRGEYQNASHFCRHCYPGNPARISWDRDYITVEARPTSSKTFRALVVYRQVVRPVVGTYMPTPVEELRGLKLVRFPDEEEAETKEFLAIEKCYTNSMKAGEVEIHSTERWTGNGPVRYELCHDGESIVLRKIYLGDDENPNTGFFVAAVDFVRLVDAIESGEPIEPIFVPFRR